MGHKIQKKKNIVCDIRYFCFVKAITWAAYTALSTVECNMNITICVLKLLIKFLLFIQCMNSDLNRTVVNAL